MNKEKIEELRRLVNKLADAYECVSSYLKGSRQSERAKEDVDNYYSAIKAWIKDNLKEKSNA